MITAFFLLIVMTIFAVLVYCKCKTVIKRYHVIKQSDSSGIYNFLRACCKRINKETQEPESMKEIGIELREIIQLDAETGNPIEGTNKRPAPSPEIGKAVKKQKLDKPNN